jgi:hypothetical protein
VSNQDSFIDEVTEEVRRDKLYATFRRYGWIAILAVVLIVGGAAFNEWRKANARADAEAVGDAVLSAFQSEAAEARVDALASVDPGDNAGRAAVLTLAQASVLAEEGEIDEAVTLLETLSIDPGAPRIYQELATLKGAIVGAELVDPETRIQRLNGLVSSGSAFSLMALEQIALAEIETGDSDAAIETLRQILIDANVTQDLRRRASQLMVSLGAPQSALQP